MTFLRGGASPASVPRRGARGAARLVEPHAARTATRSSRCTGTRTATIEERDFLTGFLRDDDDVIGRPVDVAEGPDGAIYVSDDYAGAIYRVAWGAAGAAAPRPPAAAAAGAGPAASRASEAAPPRCGPRGQAL